MPKHPQRTSTHRIHAKEKQRKALELRKAGMSYVHIARECGYSSAKAASRAANAALDELTLEPGLDVRRIQLERLNHMLLTLWPRVNAGDDSAIRSALAVMDKMDRIQGTDAPEQHEHHVTHEGVLFIEGDENSYIARMKQMSERLGVLDVQGRDTTPQGPTDSEGLGPGVGEGDAVAALDPAPTIPTVPVNGNGHSPVAAVPSAPHDEADGQQFDDQDQSEHPCPRFVKSRDIKRADMGFCARCDFKKADHNND